MKKWNGIILYFIIIIHLLQCSNATANFDKLESEIESENFLTNKLLIQLCGFKEGRLNLIAYDAKKKIIANPIFLNFDSQNFNLYNKDKKSIIKSFKTQDLLRLNKIPLVRPVPKDHRKNCFELIFKNSDKKTSVKIKQIPITLCASNQDQKFGFLKDIANKKQCSLNRYDKLVKGIDREKLYKNCNTIEKLIKKKNKNSKKMKTPDNFYSVI